MKKIILVAFYIVASVSTFAQNYEWGIGLRLGDPSGITVKRPLTSGTALELNFGSSTYWGYDFNRRFEDIDDYEPSWRYTGYNRRGSWTLQAHLLFHNDISGAPGLQWYYGFGGQLRVAHIEFLYERYHAAPPYGWGWYRGTERYTDFGIGADGVLGLEYTFEDFPISVFLDGTFYLEILNDPLWYLFQWGLGGRWNF